VVQGAAGAALLPSSLSLLRQAFPDAARRARAIGIWSAISGVAGVAGPTLGGLLVAAGGWRLAFLVNVPLCALGLLLSARILCEAPRSHARRVDAGAQGLLVAALAGVVVVLIETPHRGLADPVVLAGLAIGASAGMRLLTRRVADRAGLLPPGFFARRTVAATAVAALLHNLGGYGAVFVLSLCLQLERGWAPLETGLALLPMPAGMSVMSLLAGRLVRPLGARALMGAGMAVAGLGIGGLALLQGDTQYARIAICLLATGVGSGLVVPAMTAVMLAAVPSEHAGVSGAVLSTARQLGTALGVATIGGLATSGPDLGSGLAPAMAAAGATLGLGAVLSLACVRRLTVRPRPVSGVTTGTEAGAAALGLDCRSAT
jgi:DHA2 family methylenomycin A resistance protein-like MFS transporter